MSNEAGIRVETMAELRALRQEVSELRRRAAGLEASPDADEISYRELVQSANTIVLRWDLQGRVTFLNEFGLEFFGFTLDELVGRSVVGSIVPETDTSGRDLTRMIAELLEHPERYVNNENENVRQNGDRVWITWRNRALRDEAGRVRELLSIGMDTTERKRAEEALRDSERRYRVLFESTPIALVERDASALKAHLEALQAAGVTDFEAYLREHPDVLPAFLEMVKVTDMNAAAMELFETHELADLQSFPYNAEQERFASMVRSIIADLSTANIVSQQREETIRTLRGAVRIVVTRTTVVPGFETTLSRIVTALIDVTERKQAWEALRASEERFRFLSEHDNLTGLFNRRYLYDTLETLLGAASGLCSLLFMDLDGFKSVVDRHGHLHGSRAIQEVAQIIQACIPAPGFAVAYAGDEFVMVLPGLSKAQAMITAGEVQAQIGAHAFLTAVGLTVHMTASLGVATYPEDAADMRTLLAVADRALFNAKEMGRNRVLAAGFRSTWAETA
jgi:diguanylate cyclase (GGDEF)-like protein/PAS domain S-box-containing protein